MKSKILIAVFLLAGIAVNAQTPIKTSNGTSLLYNGSTQTYAGFDVSQDAPTGGTGSGGAMITSGAFEQFSFNPPVFTGTAYAAGNVIGTPITLGTAARNAGGGVELKNVLVIDNNSPNAHPAMEVLLFDEPSASLTGTYTDHAAVGISPSDLTHIIRAVPIAYSNYATVSSTNTAVADVSASNAPMLASGTNVSFAAVAVATGTSGLTTGTAPFTFKFGLNKD